MMDEIGIGLGGVLSLEVDSDVLVDRLGKRALLENRADDTEATVKNRLRVYQEQTAPLIDFYAGRGALKSLDGEGSVEDVQGRVLAAVRAGAGPGAGSEKRA
jgi:adenylate kinase